MSTVTEQPVLSERAPAPELPAVAAPVATEARTSRKATWALVSGIVGLIVAPLLFATVAIALGVVAKNEMDQDPQLQGQGQATAGIVLGVIGLLVFAVVLVTTMSTS
jgi:hypothetical protein